MRVTIAILAALMTGSCVVLRNGGELIGGSPRCTEYPQRIMTWHDGKRVPVPQPKYTCP